MRYVMHDFDVRTLSSILKSRRTNKFKVYDFLKF